MRRPFGRVARRATGLAASVALLVGAAAAAAPPASAIVAGTPTPVASVPWVVQLQDQYGQFCTGSLIRPRVVLTAAHCLVGAKRVRVVVGRQTTEGVDGTAYLAVRRAYDPRFRSSRTAGKTVGSDVGLLELRDPVVGVVPVTLAGPEHASLLAAGAPVTISGWGVTNDRRRTLQSGRSRSLRSVVVPLRSKTWCNRRLESDAPGVLCAGRLRRPVAGSCYGDSGGPVHLSTPAGILQIGVVSSGGERCGVAPTFHARVLDGRARRWIDARITADGGLRGGAQVR